MKKILAAFTVMASCSAAPATAEMQCIPTYAAAQWLEQNRMTMASRGMAENVEVVIYADPMTGRFAIIARPDPGISCMVASGSGFEQAAWGHDT